MAAGYPRTRVAKSREKRDHCPVTEQRHDSRQIIEIKVVYEAVDKFFVQSTRNVSKGGLFIATSAPQPVGSVFRLVLRLPKDMDAFELRAQVRWVRHGDTPGTGRGMGVQLLWENEQQREAFEHAVERLTASVSSV